MNTKTKEKDRQILSLSVKQSEEVIRVDFSEKDIAEMKTQIAKKLIKQYDLEEKLQVIKDEYKEKINPLKKEIKEHLKNVRLGFEDVQMMVHNIPDEDKGVVEFYDDEGTKVGERKMDRSEKASIKFPK